MSLALINVFMTCLCVTELVDWTHAGVLAQAETLCLSQRGSFSNWIRATNNETSAETGTARGLFNGQRMEKQNLVHKSASQPNLGGDVKCIGGSR